MYADARFQQPASGAPPHDLRGGCATSDGVRLTGSEVASLLRVQPAPEEREEFDRLSFTTRRVKTGESLYRPGDAFDMLYVVRSGFLKTLTRDPFGGEQVVAFPMPGDIVGADGLEAGRHTCEVQAIDTCDVVLLPFERALRACGHGTTLATMVYRAIGREIVRDHGLLWMLGTLTAEARVAAFILNLGQRFAAIGYSGKKFLLRMKREEIGSLIGMQLETVSRTLCAFARAGYLKVNQREIEIIDAAGLRALIESPTLVVSERARGTAHRRRRAFVQPRAAHPSEELRL